MIVKNILKSARDLTDEESLHSTIIKIIDKDKEPVSSYSVYELICIFHIIEYSITIFVQRLKNNSIKWFSSEGSTSIDQILNNLNYTKNILIKEKNQLIDKL